jgi:hypothetical protein
MEIIAVFYEIRTEHANKLCGQNVEFFSIVTIDTPLTIKVDNFGILGVTSHTQTKLSATAM